ncbi:MAG: hypothetical protein JXM70_19455 [Pirellulales bacterium]|nr:hypothetical protein [Pirellulales bacterium]
MLQITNKAAAHLKSALSELDFEEGACFRIGVAEEEVKLVVDQQRPGDSTIEHEHDVLVVIDPVSSDILDKFTIDFNETTKQLVFS